MSLPDKNSFKSSVPNGAQIRLSARNGSKKHITVVMIPYERYSVFPQAVEKLYQNLDVPFHLIVIEGNAPDSIRSSLENQKKQHKNMTIIYTNHCPQAAEAVNLALAHVRSKYIFIMDNETEALSNCLKVLLKDIREKGFEIVYPRTLGSNGSNDTAQAVPSIDPQMRPFLISREALSRLGEFSENISALFFDLNLSIKARARNLRMSFEPKALVKRGFDSPMKPMDMKIFDLQWNVGQARDSMDHLSKEWNLELPEKDYLSWLEDKRQRLTVSKPFFLMDDVANLFQNDFFRAARKGVKRLLQPLTKS